MELLHRFRSSKVPQTVGRCLEGGPCRLAAAQAQEFCRITVLPRCQLVFLHAADARRLQYH